MFPSFTKEKKSHFQEWKVDAMTYTDSLPQVLHADVIVQVP